MIFGGIEHQTWAYLRGEGDFSLAECAEGITEVIMRGISADRPTGDALTDAVARLERVAEALERRPGAES